MLDQPPLATSNRNGRNATPSRSGTQRLVSLRSKCSITSDTTLTERKLIGAGGAFISFMAISLARAPALPRSQSGRVVRQFRIQNLPRLQGNTPERISLRNAHHRPPAAPCRRKLRLFARLQQRRNATRDRVVVGPVKERHR